MSDTKGPHEPSMEEILASIRRIIAEDADAPAGEKPADKPADKVESDAMPAHAAAAAPPEDDVLELTEVIEEDAPVTAPQSPTALDDGPAHVPHEAEDDRLLSSTSAAASVAAMTQLVGRSQRDRGSEMPLGAVDRTLEDIVRELLRPLLRDWLDEHLPQLVERLVKDELDRLAREAHGR